MVLRLRGNRGEELWSRRAAPSAISRVSARCGDHSRRIVAQGGAVHFVGIGPSIEEATEDAAR